jgi:hypothetical protein
VKGKMAGAYLTCLVAIAFILSQVINTLLRLAGIPNIFIPTREVLLVGLAIAALRRIGFNENRLFYGSALALVIIIIANVFVAIFEGRHFEGLFYARLYALPLLFSVACYGWILTIDEEEIKKVGRFLYILGVFVMFCAVLIYFAAEGNPGILSTLISGQENSQLAVTWYIAGGWMRMGLPATAPNSLGVIAALLYIFGLSLNLSGMASALRIRYSWILLLLTCGVLILTFSRSSWLGAFAGTCVLFITCWKIWKIGESIGLFRLFASVLSILLGIVIFAYFIDIYSDGIVGRWITYNLTGTDPSMVGHGNSIENAWELAHQYYLFGYPRGTVGPRAAQFGGDFNNVESSVFAVFYDMGIPIGILFMIFSSLIIVSMFRHISQLAPMLILFLVMQFLPHVFSPDINIFFLIIYTVLGKLMSTGGSLRCADGCNRSVACAPSLRR